MYTGCAVQTHKSYQEPILLARAALSTGVLFLDRINRQHARLKMRVPYISILLLAGAALQALSPPPIVGKQQGTQILSQFQV